MIVIFPLNCKIVFVIMCIFMNSLALLLYAYARGEGAREDPDIEVRDAVVVEHASGVGAVERWIER